MANFNGTVGNDVIIGTFMQDVIRSGNGNDTIAAGEGNNWIDAGNGDDSVIAGAGDDTVYLGEGNNWLSAGDGDNWTSAGRGNDTVIAGQGDDTITAGDGNNTVAAGNGDNWVWSGFGNDVVTAGSGDDDIYVGDGNNQVSAGDGDNYVVAWRGDDTVTTGTGSDVIYAGEGNNLVLAGDGDNWIYAGSGNDSVTAGSGDDAIYVGQGDNRVSAGDGDNWIVVGNGNDTVTTGEGDDAIAAWFGNNVVNAGNGDNFVAVASGNDAITTGTGSDLIWAGDGDNVIDAGAGYDVALAGWGNDLFIHRLAGNTLSGGYRDIYEGGFGRDTLRLELTSAEWARADVQSDVAAFQAHLQYCLNRVLNPLGLATHFNFSATSLTVFNIENLEIMVNGVLLDPRDEAVTAVLDQFNATEDSVSVSVDLLANDAVPDRAVSVELLSNSTLGTLALTPDLDGAVQSAMLTFIPNATQQSLAAGQSVTETISYRVTDADGDTSTASITITVVGQNDGATISGLSTGAVAEDGGALVSGTLAVSDVDTAEAVFQLASGLTGTYGSFAFNAVSGAWTYDLDDAAANVQALRAGEVVSDRITVTSLDGTASQEIAVTITGTNDAPVVAAAVTAAAYEADASQTINLLAGASDLDAGETATLSVANVTGLVAGLTLTGNTLVLDATDPTFDDLAAGQTRDLTVTYDVVDAQGAIVAQTATITITGTNDTPVVAAAVTAAANEGTASQTINLLAGASDLDAGETATLSVANVTGLVAGLTLTGNTLVLDPGNTSFNALAAGQTRTVAVTYDVIDTQGARVAQTATITVTGTNDAPVVAATVTAGASEGTAVRSINLLANASDADAGETATLRVANVTGLVDGLTLSGNSIVLDPNDASFNSLAQGQTRAITLTYSVIDAQGASVPQTATITITGTNDRPVMSAAQPFAVVEDTVISGQVVATDADTGDAASLTYALSSPATAPAGLTFNPNGSFTFNAASYDSLAQGQTGSVSFNVNARDQFGAVSLDRTVVIQITGTNDAPVATTVSLSGGQTVNTGFNQGFTGWTVTLGPQTGPNGETARMSSYTSSATILTNGSMIPGDNAVADLQFNTYLNQYFDGPTIGTIFGPSLVSNSFTGISGDTVNFVYRAVAGSDDASITAVLVNVQTGATIPVFFANTRAGTTGPVQTANIPIADSGVYQIRFTVGGFDASDGGLVGARLLIGTAGILRSGVGEDTQRAFDAITFTGSVTDPDQGAVISLASVDALSQNGAAVSINSAGQVVYDAAPLDILAAGETLNDSFTYTIRDQFGATSSATATIAVQGVNDAPVVAAIVTAAATEGDASRTISLLTGATDADRGETATLRVANVTGLVPGLTLAGTNVVLDPTSSVFNSLAQGQTRAITLSYNVIDAQGASVAQTATITVTGSNDAPTMASAPSTGSTTGAAFVPGDLIPFGDFEGNPTPDIGNSHRLGAANGWTLTTTNNIFDAGVLNVASTLFTTSQSLPGGDLVAFLNPGASMQQNIQVPENQFAVAFDVITRADNPVGATYRIEVLVDGQSVGLQSINVGPNQAQTLQVREVFDLSTVPGYVAGLSVVTLEFENTGATPAQFNFDDVRIGTTDQRQVGSVAFADVDLADTHSVSVQAQDAGYVGTLTAAVGNAATGDGTGRIDWTFDFQAEDFAFLAQGQTRDQTYNLTLNDTNGGTTSKAVTVTLVGTNDGPVTNGPATASVGALDLIQGTLVANGDFETGPFPDVGGIANYATPTGWTEISNGAPYFAAGSALMTNSGQQMPTSYTGTGVLGFSNGQATLRSAIGQQPETFAVSFDMLTRLDGNGPTVYSVNVLVDGQNVGLIQTGTGPAPGATAQQVHLFDLGGVAGFVPGVSLVTLEFGNPRVVETQFNFDNVRVGQAVTQASGSLAFSDADIGDSHSATVVSDAGNIGQLVLTGVTGNAAAGTGAVGWTFTAPAAQFAALAIGETRVQGYDVTITDAFGTSRVERLEVQIVGTNDAPTLAPQVGLAANNPIMTDTSVGTDAFYFLQAQDVDGYNTSFAVQPDRFNIYDDELIGVNSDGGVFFTQSMNFNPGSGADNLYVIGVNVTDDNGGILVRDVYIELFA